jgi:ABC-type Na+ efflux pump permease subunit
MPLPELLKTITSFVSVWKPLVVIALFIFILLLLLVGAAIAMVVVTVKQGGCLKAQAEAMKDHVTRQDLKAWHEHTMSSVRSTIMESNYEVGKQLTAQANATAALIATVQTMYSQNAQLLAGKTDNTEKVPKIDTTETVENTGYGELAKHMQTLAKFSVQLSQQEQNRQTQVQQTDDQKHQHDLTPRSKSTSSTSLSDHMRYRSADQAAPIMSRYDTDCALSRSY